MVSCCDTGSMVRQREEVVVGGNVFSGPRVDLESQRRIGNLMSPAGFTQQHDEP